MLGVAHRTYDATLFVSKSSRVLKGHASSRGLGPPTVYVNDKAATVAEPPQTYVNAKEEMGEGQREGIGKRGVSISYTNNFHSNFIAHQGRSKTQKLGGGGDLPFLPDAS